MPNVIKLCIQLNGLGKLPKLCGSVGAGFYTIFMNHELSIKIIRELEKKPEESQRNLSKRYGVSLGSIHSCTNALMEKGYAKVRSFKNAQNKLTFNYILTPLGINLKKKPTRAFLKRTKAEYEALQKEIEALEDDLVR